MLGPDLPEFIGVQIYLVFFIKTPALTGFDVLDSKLKRVKEHDAAGMGRFGIAVDCR
jgi:hypothetical protein